MSAPATKSETVVFDREKLIRLLVEIEGVVNFHNDLAGVSPAPLTEDLDRAAFELAEAVFGEILNEHGEWVGVGARVDEEGRLLGRDLVDAVFGLAVAS